MDFNPFDVLPAASLDDLVENIEALAAGTGLNNNAVTFTQLANGVAIQSVGTMFGAMATGTTLITYDDSIPQITEGTEFMTQAITPKATTSILVIEVIAHVSNTIGNFNTVALFQDATANALAATTEYDNTSNQVVTIPLRHRMVAGTTSPTTFRVRIGGSIASTVTFNGTGGARRLGGVSASSIMITEYRA